MKSLALTLLLMSCCPIVFTGCPSGSVRQPVAKDSTTIVVYSRHTFRGISSTVGPQKISLPDYGIDIAIPNLSYVEDATPRGLEIASDFASFGLQNAAALAVAALGESRVFDGRWDEIRTDLSTERTFWTALKLREGLLWDNPSVNDAMTVTGCQTVPAAGVDVINSSSEVGKCVPKEVLQPLLEASPDLPKLKARGEELLNVVRSSIGASGPQAVLPAATYTNSKLPQAYGQIASLSSIVEMSAELGPPLLLLFQNTPATPLIQYGRAAVTAALNTLGIQFFTAAPDVLADAISTWPVDFINSRPKASHTIVVSHDDFISAMLRSLGLITRESEPSDLAIYPIESIVFAISDSTVSIVRMRIFTDAPSGYIPGPYAHKLIWKGSRADWDSKVLAVSNRAKAWNLGTTGNACIKALKVCNAEKLNVAY